MRKKIKKRKRKNPLLILILFLALVVFGLKAIFFNDTKITDDTIADESQELEFKDDAKPQKSDWKKIKENLFLDINSLQGEKSDYVMGTFKQKNIDEKINSKTAKAVLIELGAYCNIKANDNLKKIDYPNYTYLDKNNDVIETQKPSQDWKQQYEQGNLGVVSIEDIKDGETFFDALCN